MIQHKKLGAVYEREGLPDLVADPDAGFPPEAGI